MARAAQRGATAITTWMIIFAALWLTSTVFVIVLYTGQEEILKENDQLQRVSGQLISSKERQSIGLIRNLVDGGPTAVGILEGARQQTAAVATGDGADDHTACRSKRDQLVDDIVRDGAVANATNLEGRSFWEIATTLHGDLKAQAAQLEGATDRVATLEQEVDRLEQQNSTEKDNFEAKLAELRDDLKAAEAQHVTYRDQRDKSTDDLERGFEERRAACDADLAQERVLSAELRRGMDSLKRRFSVQEEKFGGSLAGPEALATVREPDGVILSAVPGDDAVYIDRGRKDRLTLGLQFAVYSAEGGVPTGGRAKAQIEVVAIMEETAECRITRVSPGAVLVAGDIIANPVYDASSPQQFMVIGEFDLNHDGVADRNGGAVVESLIQDWGGQLTQDLAATTDFVVVGAAPRLPRGGPRQDLTAEQARKRAEMKDAHDRYTKNLQKATSLSIPVLPQDLFLNYLGYRGGRASGRSR